VISRRSFLGGVSAALASAPFLASNAQAATNLPMTVVNNTAAHPSSAIWVYVVGVDLATGRQCYVNASGALVPVSLADNGPDGFTDYAIPLRSSGNTTVNLPNMSGRVYFSIGSKLKIRAVVDGAGRPALQYPAGWVSSDPNYPILHDFTEFTFNGAGMFCNTTMVDQFSIPLAINLTGAKNQTTGALPSGARSRIFSGIAAVPEFSRLVVGDGLRVIAPGHGLDAGLFSSSYFDSYVDQVWAKYQSTNLTVTTNTGTFTGRVSGNTLAFSGGVRSFSKPSTRDVLFCDGALAAPNDGISGPVAAVLGAGFNRSTLVSNTSQPTTDPSTFYRQPITNHYSKVLHENTVDGKAYGFAFDDVADFASYVQDTAPTSFTVTLTPF
jgi:hypothetical protein